MARSTGLFIVVEGRSIDAPFYEGIAKSSSLVRGRGHQIWLIEQISKRAANPSPGSKPPPGGKDAVLKLYDYCRRKGALALRNSGGTNAIAFCLDRDNDDVALSVRRSKHVIYTAMYDAEAHAFSSGKTMEAIVMAASLDERSAKGFVDAHPRWIDDLAVVWREWIELCCLAKAHKSWCHVGFGKDSCVNDDTYGTANRSEVARALSVIERKSQIDPAKRARVYSIVRARVNRAYSQGNAARLVRGKWLPDYLEYLLAAHFRPAPIGLRAFVDKALVAFLATLDYNEPWADHFRVRFERLLLETNT